MQPAASRNNNYFYQLVAFLYQAKLYKPFDKISTINGGIQMRLM